MHSLLVIPNIHKINKIWRYTLLHSLLVIPNIYKITNNIWRYMLLHSLGVIPNIYKKTNNYGDICFRIPCLLSPTYMR